jgi:hypothetical protein
MYTVVVDENKWPIVYKDLFSAYQFTRHSMDGIIASPPDRNVRFEILDDEGRRIYQAEYEYHFLY